MMTDVAQDILHCFQVPKVLYYNLWAQCFFAGLEDSFGKCTKHLQKFTICRGLHSLTKELNCCHNFLLKISDHPYPTKQSSDINNCTKSSEINLHILVHSIHKNHIYHLIKLYFFLNATAKPKMIKTHPLAISKLFISFLIFQISTLRSALDSSALYPCDAMTLTLHSPAGTQLWEGKERDND